MIFPLRFSMIAFIKRLHQRLRRTRHAREARPRLEALRPDIERVCGGSVSFAPTDGGGHDYVFYVKSEGRRTAVLRLANHQYISAATPASYRINGPYCRLPPLARIAREHRICQKGGELGITPRPLWLSGDGEASMNAFVEGQRMLALAKTGAVGFWDALDRTAARAAQFHAVIGEAHMDLSLMNVIADAREDRLVLIDFELSPNPALTPDEAFLFDFLNLVEMAYKFMPLLDRQAADLRLDPFLSRYADPYRTADLSKMGSKLPRIFGDPVYREILARHFSSIPSPPRT